MTRLDIKSPYSDIGQHTIRLAIGRYDAELPRERQPASLAETCFTGPIAYTGKSLPSVIESLEGGSSLVPHWVKTAEDGACVIRLHEVAGRRGQLKVNLKPGYKLLLTDIGESSKAECKDVIDFTPYQVVSLLIRKKA